MIMDYSYLDRNAARVRASIENARERSKHNKEISMVVAVKYADVEEINYLCDNLGVTDIGENRVQQIGRAHV